MEHGIRIKRISQFQSLISKQIAYSAPMAIGATKAGQNPNIKIQNNSNNSVISDDMRSTRLRSPEWRVSAE